MPDEPSDVLTPEEAADILRIAPKTARKWCRDGTMPGLLPSLGRFHRISRRQLEAWVSNEEATA